MSWDDDDAPTPGLSNLSVKAGDKWANEDKEGGEVLDSWEEVDKPKAAANPAPAAKKPAAKAPAKAGAKGKGKEKEKEKEPAAPLSKEEQDAAKRRAKDQVLKADFGNLQDAFGISGSSADDETATNTLANFVPITEEDFVELARRINEKLQPIKGSFHYSKLVKALMRHMSSDMKTEDAKEMVTTANVLLNERIAADKAKDGKKKKTSTAPVKKQVNTKTAMGDDDEEYDSGDGGDLDAFK
jgi:hypothetical protein